MESLGWAVVHMCWQGLLLGAWWLLFCQRAAAPRQRYRFGWSVLGVMGVVFVATAALFMLPGAEALVGRGVDGVAGLLGTRGGGGPGGRPAGESAARTATLIGWIWSACVVVLLVRQAGGWHLARRIFLVGSRPARDHWQAAGRAIAAQLGLRDTPRLLESERVDSPAVFGIVRPVIVLPAAGLELLTPLQTRGVLAHELMHIRRRDGLANLCQCALDIVLFFHPLVRVVSRRVRHRAGS